VPLDLVDKAIKNLPKDKRASLQNVAMTVNRDSRKVELTTTDLRHEQRVAGYPKNEPFPDWKGVLRKIRGEGEPSRLCLNRKDLMDLLSAMDEACPDKGGENPIYLEIHPEGRGLLLRCNNRETGQRAVGGVTAYKIGDHWLPMDPWERRVFQRKIKKLKRP